MTTGPEAWLELESMAEAREAYLATLVDVARARLARHVWVSGGNPRDMQREELGGWLWERVAAVVWARRHPDAAAP